MARRSFIRLAPPTLLWILLGFCFFGSLGIAIAYFPHGYDWRRDVISSLASPRDNPRAYEVACAGMAMSGLLLLPFPIYLADRMASIAPGLTAWAGRLFSLGSGCLTLSALIVPGHYRILGLARTHEHLAQVSSVAFCVSLVMYFAILLRIRTLHVLHRVAVLVIVILPVTALVLSRLALGLSYTFCSEPVYHAIKVSRWSSLALWEWIGAVCIYLFWGWILVARLDSRTRADDQESL